MNFCASFTIGLSVLCLLLVPKTTSQNVASSFLSSEHKWGLSTNEIKPTRLGKIVNLFRKTISKFRPTRKGFQKEYSRKIVRKAINDLPFHETSNEVDAKIHQLIPPHQVDRKSMEEVNSYESEALSEDDTILDKLSSYAILSHSEPSFAKVVLSNPHYKKATMLDPSETKVPANSVHPEGKFHNNLVYNGTTDQNIYSASSNFVNSVLPLSIPMTSETGLHAMPINYINSGVLIQNSHTGGSSILANGVPSLPNVVTSGSVVRQVRYLPSPFQMTGGRSAYQLGLPSRDFSVTPLDSNRISSNYQGTILPMVQEGLIYQEYRPIRSGSSYQSSAPIQGDTVYQIPSYQVSQVTSVKPATVPTQNQYRPYIAHPPSKTSGLFYKPVYTISKNLFGKPLKPNTFVKQNMNKLMQTIYPYYHK